MVISVHALLYSNHVSMQVVLLFLKSIHIADIFLCSHDNKKIMNPRNVFWLLEKHREL